MFYNLAREISIFLDRIVYGFLEHVFQLIMDLANFQLFTSKTISSFANRIYLILGLVMVFKLMISFIQILIDPNKMDDKEQGLGGILKRVIISLVLIVLVPSIFDLARKLQNEILPVIPKVVLGVKADMSNEDITNSAGQVMSYYSFLPFFYYADEINCNTGALAGTGSDNPTISRVGDISREIVTEKKCSTTSDGYTYRYQAFISTIAGAYLVYVLITVAVKIAIRAIKFSLCEIIAPIPIASYIDPKQSKESFDNWVKTSTKVYIDLFVRLAVVYFIIYIFQLLFNGENGSKLQETIGQYGFDRGLLVILFIIVGLLNFAKDMPKFVSDMLGMKDGFGDMADMFRGTGWRQLRDTGRLLATPLHGLRDSYQMSQANAESRSLSALRGFMGGFGATGRALRNILTGKEVGEAATDARITTQQRTKTGISRTRGFANGRNPTFATMTESLMAQHRENARNRMGLPSTKEAMDASISSFESITKMVEDSLSATKENKVIKFYANQYEAAKNVELKTFEDEVRSDASWAGRSRSDILQEAQRRQATYVNRAQIALSDAQARALTSASTSGASGFTIDDLINGGFLRESDRGNVAAENAARQAAYNDGGHLSRINSNLGLAQAIINDKMRDDSRLRTELQNGGYLNASGQFEYLGQTGGDLKHVRDDARTYANDIRNSVEYAQASTTQPTNNNNGNGGH